MDRRTFNKLVAAGVGRLPSLSNRQGSTAAYAHNANPEPPGKWPGQVYRRLLVDTHIPDWNPLLLSRFNAAEYVATIAGAGFKALMQYAISCAGLCLWRTKIGTMHRNMHGRDYFGEVMNECARHGLQRVAYFHVIWDNHAFVTQPNWRFQPADGEDRILKGRYGYTCINSPYRHYALALARELVTNYEFEGIFNDMILWPGVCYCPYCTARFWKEHNAEPPRVVDWDDSLWRTFQAARQRWMLEFAQEFTDTVKKVRSITVEQQFGTVFADWRAGVPLQLGTETCDYVGGDFYGGPAQFSLVCKAFNSLSRKRPFEFMTSLTSNLTDFVTLKPTQELQIESGVPMIHSAAFLAIDALKPDGTLHHEVYDMLRRINAERASYEPFLGGKLLADVAIYYDKESMYNPEEQKVHVEQLTAPHRTPHFEAVIGWARILRAGHIPFGVITNITLNQLADYRAVILPNVLEMTSDQATLFRAFVRQGGVVYASGSTSLSRLDKRYLLEDVLGVRYQGRVGTLVTYFTPKDEWLKRIAWPQSNIIYNGTMIQVTALPTAEILASVTLPFVNPEAIDVIKSNFAQIISDPPALTPGSDPALVVNTYGRGKAIWAAAPLESSDHRVNGELIRSLLQRIVGSPWWFEADIHPAVEVTLFDQPNKQRLLLGLLNMQEQLPLVPVSGTLRVRMPVGRHPVSITRVPTHQRIHFEMVGPYLEFHVEPFDVLSMTLIEYA
jgi:hypothetical protein